MTASMTCWMSSDVSFCSGVVIAVTVGAGVARGGDSDRAREFLVCRLIVIIPVVLFRCICIRCTDVRTVVVLGERPVWSSLIGGKLPRGVRYDITSCAAVFYTEITLSGYFVDLFVITYNGVP